MRRSERFEIRRLFKAIPQSTTLSQQQEDKPLYAKNKNRESIVKICNNFETPFCVTKEREQFSNIRRIM